MPEVNSENESSVHVRMKTSEEALAAITKLNGRTFDGRQLKAQYFPVKEFEKLEATSTSYIVNIEEPEAENPSTSSIAKPLKDNRPTDADDLD